MTGSQPIHHGENQNQQRAKREIGNREAKQSEKADSVIGGRRATLRGNDSSRNSNGAANDEGGEGEFERRRVVFEDDAENRLLKAKRFAEIAADHAGKIMPILLGQRLVETERVAQLKQVGSGGAFAEHLLHRIARDDVREKKNHGENQPQRRKRIGETK